ncbi:signal peptidase I [Patescibacteria group bacterium]|nr:signal peptidase I [Patescibacteria group bacterium]
MEPDLYTDLPKKSFLAGLGNHFVEFFQTIVIFGAIFASIYLFIAQFHKVSGNSMVPTFQSNDYLITEKVSYRFRDPKKGEVIVLKNPRDESQEFIKRIIAVPGDSLHISKNSLFINGQKVNEDFLPPDTQTMSGAFIKEDSIIKAGDNQYFVFGDNRNNSSDSRNWGPITKEEIVGRAFFRYYPIPDIGLLTNE